MNTRTEIAQLVTAVFATFPNSQATEETIKVYVRILEDLPLEALTAAVEQSIAECRFLPTVADIRERAIALITTQRKSPLEAWGIVCEAMRIYGFYRSPKFDDDLIARAVNCIGWQTLCSSENQIADRAHFSKIYEQLVEREAHDARLLPRARELRRQVQEEGPIKEIGDGRGY